jgi:hypothetical protein
MKSFRALILLVCLSTCKQHNPNHAEEGKTVSTDTLVEFKTHTISKTNVNAGPDSSKSTEKKWLIFRAKHFFHDYPALVYSGPLASPDFNSVPEGKDSVFRKLVLSILKKDDSINFAGRFTAIHPSCGAMCSSIFLIDRKTGRMYNGLPANEEGRWGYEYKANSTMIIANSEMLSNDRFCRYSPIWGIKPEIYDWRHGRMKRLQ